jgi:hypothetical protein
VHRIHSRGLGCVRRASSQQEGYLHTAKRNSCAATRDYNPVFTGKPLTYLTRLRCAMHSHADGETSCAYPHRRRPRFKRGGAYTFGGGKGSRTGSGQSFARIALSERMRGENGYLSPSMVHPWNIGFLARQQQRKRSQHHPDARRRPQQRAAEIGGSAAARVAPSSTRSRLVLDRVEVTAGLIDLPQRERVFI